MSRNPHQRTITASGPAHDHRARVLRADRAGLGREPRAQPELGRPRARAPRVAPRLHGPLGHREPLSDLVPAPVRRAEPLAVGRVAGMQPRRLLALRTCSRRAYGGAVTMPDDARPHPRHRRERRRLHGALGAADGRRARSAAPASARMRRVEVPVLVVGAGPVGMMARSCSRGRASRAAVVERRAGPAPRAAGARREPAHARDLPRGRRRHGARCAPRRRRARTGRRSSWMTTSRRRGARPPALRAAGRRRARRHADAAAQPLAASLRADPARAARAPTPRRRAPLRPRVAGARAGRGRRHVARSSDLASGERYEVRSRCLLAADGAGSRVRKALGIEMIGPDRLQSFVMIHFEANLRALVRDAPGDPLLDGRPRVRRRLRRARHRPHVGLHAPLRSRPRAAGDVHARARARRSCGAPSARDVAVRRPRREPVDDDGAGRRALSRRPRLPRRRRRAPLSAHGRARPQHRRAGRAQPRLEARRVLDGAAPRRAARHLRDGAPAGRAEERRPEPAERDAACSRSSTRSASAIDSAPTRRGARAHGGDARRAGGRARVRPRSRTSASTSTCSACSSASPTRTARSSPTAAASRASRTACATTCRRAGPARACRTPGSSAAARALDARPRRPTTASRSIAGPDGAAWAHAADAARAATRRAPAATSPIPTALGRARRHRPPTARCSCAPTSTSPGAPRGGPRPREPISRRRARKSSPRVRARPSAASRGRRLDAAPPRWEGDRVPLVHDFS